MISISLIPLFLAAATTSASQLGLDTHAPQDLAARSTDSSGGWALSSNQSVTCPAETTSCYGTFCCPNSLTCFNGPQQGAIDNLCCPGGQHKFSFNSY